MLKSTSPFELIPEDAGGGGGATTAAPPSSTSGVSAPTMLEESGPAVTAAAAMQHQLLAAQQMAAARPQLLLQQHVLQQQLLQRQILEHQMQQVENQRQLSVLLQTAQLKKAKEEEEAVAAAAAVAAASDLSSSPSSAVDHQERMRLEILRQKSRHDQSAVASPEVKRHLQEFVLQKKRKEASAASMGNLKLVPTAPLPPSQPMLRKTVSESNLLKMKSKRSLASTPYARALHPAIPEDAAVSNVSPTGSKSQTSSPPVELSSPSSLDLRMAPPTSTPTSSSGGSLGSAPTSPKTQAAMLELHGQASGKPPPFLGRPLLASSAQQRSLDAGNQLGSSTLNSKSLPNIPTAVSRLAGKESLFKRKSPPPHFTCSNSSIRPPPHHGAMIVRRSKSSAILPLRKHLIEKTLQDNSKKQAMDEEQFYFAQKQMARERLMIRPIEEVMEDEKPMEVDGQQANSAQATHTISARLGPSGLSPLVLGEVGSISSDYVTRLLPQKPLDLAVAPSGDQTGLGYDPLMLRHHCACESAANHPENPNRVLAIWNRIVQSGLADRCVKVARRATLEEIQSCHSETHTLVYGTDMVNRCSLTGSQELHRESRMGKFCRLECGGVGVDSDTYWNELETPAAVRTAVGTLIELSQKVARGDLRNGFAIIRPPGHHAEQEEAMGFCYFNSVAIAAKQVLKMPTVKRVLVIDWAIHHGNATQKAFYEDPNVLYISLHRHDHGNFYPGTGGPVECGSGPGLGFNINVAWAGGLDPPMGDAEYLAAFRSVIMPVARSFDPDIVLVSCGFDAAAGHPHPIGGYLVSTACFAYLTHQLRQLARGKVVLALEGGFNLDVLAEASEQCIRALLGLPIDKIEEGELARRPCPAATETLQKTLAIHTPYWDLLRRHPESALLSHLEAWEKSREENDTLSAMASLSVENSRYLSNGQLESDEPVVLMQRTATQR